MSVPRDRDVETDHTHCRGEKNIRAPHGVPARSGPSTQYPIYMIVDV